MLNLLLLFVVLHILLCLSVLDADLLTDLGPAVACPLSRYNLRSWSQAPLVPLGPGAATGVQDFFDVPPVRVLLLL